MVWWTEDDYRVEGRRQKVERRGKVEGRRQKGERRGKTEGRR